LRRFYLLDVRHNLFGCVFLINTWGRIGAHGRLVTEPFDSEALAAKAYNCRLTARESGDIGMFHSVVSPTLFALAAEELKKGQYVSDELDDADKHDHIVCRRVRHGSREEWERSFPEARFQKGPVPRHRTCRSRPRAGRKTVLGQDFPGVEGVERGCRAQGRG
jgi:hypothetical protein